MHWWAVGTDNAVRCRSVDIGAVSDGALGEEAGIGCCLGVAAMPGGVAA